MTLQFEVVCEGLEVRQRDKCTSMYVSVKTKTIVKGCCGLKLNISIFVNAGSSNLKTVFLFTS